MRHIGSSSGLLKEEEIQAGDVGAKTFRRGANAAIIGERLLSLGMTCDRLLFNSELDEKCAQAYVIARTCDRRISRIPLWVRLIANHRLLKDEAVASRELSHGLGAGGDNRILSDCCAIARKV